MCNVQHVVHMVWANVRDVQKRAEIHTWYNFCTNEKLVMEKVPLYWCGSTDGLDTCASAEEHNIHMCVQCHSGLQTMQRQWTYGPT